ncbi:iron-sulfur cluster assembly accessory protein [Alphaproteobacteria bacterium]|nr:iron-sulfur cluster assembly accessory protein [Alphaproteobacteria bacterium]
MNDVLNITENASKQIKKLIKSGPQGTKGLLIGVDKGGCSGYSYKMDFAIDINEDEFDIVKKSDFKVFIDRKAIIFLFGSVMDYSKDKLSSRFVFKNPNEKNSCGCGESFSI